MVMLDREDRPEEELVLIEEDRRRIDAAVRRTVEASRDLYDDMVLGASFPCEIRFVRLVDARPTD